MSPLARFVLPALAAAGIAYADCSANPTATIQNGGDASAIASCTTFSGSIAIATSVSDAISLDGVKKITGDLEVLSNNTVLKSISADSLEEISGTFKMNSVTLIDTITMPKLATVDQINWIALPNFRNLGWKVSKATSITIDNTQLQDLGGIMVQSIKTLYVANNAYISNITMALKNIGESLTLTANNKDVNVSFPDMTWAYNMTFRNCSTVSLPGLQSLNGSMGFYGNMFESIAFPNLTSIGGALSFVSNTQATNISLPSLEKVGANFQIANNTKLGKIDSIPKLSSIGGALDFNGNFTDVELPALNDVRGAFNIQSTGDISQQCNGFQQLASNKKIQGKYVCAGEVSKPGGQGTTPSKTGSGSSKTGAASALNVQSNAAVGLMGILAAILM